VIDRGRAWLARFLPQGAILLAVLTFGAYLAGLVRDRIFARTYGAGAELDAYNAAFVLPELLLDVLVAAGLTAPFVPVFTTLRRDAPGDAAPFAQTVLTLAVGVMAIGSVFLFFLAPATVAVIAPGFDAPTQALYLDLFRLMLVTPILFAASITLGEILASERPFLFYASRRSSTTSGSWRAPCSSTTASGSMPQRSGRSSVPRSTSASASWA